MRYARTEAEVSATTKRHPLCECDQPCPVFRCEAKKHVGKRKTPWCRGSSCEHHEGCDTCCYRRDCA
jgi:hypothetical protein